MLKSFWFWFLMLFIVIQFIQIDAPAKLDVNPKDEIQAPAEVMSLLKRSCYDCHSSSIKAPWYYDVSPISLFVKKHVRDARNVVNFQQWNSYSKEKRHKVISKLPKAVVIRMPMASYLYMHEEANLTIEEKKILKKWARDLKEKLK